LYEGFDPDNARQEAGAGCHEILEACALQAAEDSDAAEVPPARETEQPCTNVAHVHADTSPL